MPSVIRGALGKLPLHLRMVSLLDKMLFFIKDKVGGKASPTMGNLSYEGAWWVTLGLGST